MPASVREAISDFLSQKRIAVVGASRNPKDFSQGLFRELRKRGYDAIPVNPGADEIDGIPCSHRVQDIQPPVDAALIMTSAGLSAEVVRNCQEAGIQRIWLYRASGAGAVTPGALEICREHGITVVPGYCPYMFLPETPWFHRFHGLVLKIARAYPN